MRNATRLTSAMIALGLAAVLPAGNAAAAPSPDVHVTGFDHYCIGQQVARTVYSFDLTNLGDQRRGVRGRIVWKGLGYSEVFSRKLDAGESQVKRVRLVGDQRATITFRAQEQVIMRAKLVADCDVPAP